MKKDTQQSPSKLTLELVMSAQLGNREAIDVLVRECHLSIMKVVNQSFRQNRNSVSCELADFEQEAKLHFIQAIASYNVNRFTPGGFVNYCLQKVTWRLKDFARLERKHLPYEVLEDFNDVLESDELDVPCFVIKKVQGVLALKSKRDRTIWYEKFTNGYIDHQCLNKKYGIKRNHCLKIIRGINDEIIKQCA
ncbi:hypothetical protein [Thalassotalea crassostreae]|uniref:hypothetical protein n=1 Tax=Thalassotalea crassostreae TaxID=1763536 RepID=UPI00083816C3|nr:hypothetical protein [Thalassotalea crassostreae]